MSCNLIAPECDHRSWAWQLSQRCLLQRLQLPQPLLQRCWVELQRINLWNIKARRHYY
jgi:hypothetical protein